MAAHGNYDGLITSLDRRLFFHRPIGGIGGKEFERLKVFLSAPNDGSDSDRGGKFAAVMYPKGN